MDPPALVLRLFGPFEAQVHGEPVRRLRTRTVEALLALLVLRSGREAPRSWLAGTLWPESDEARALQNLRVGLMDLRGALGTEAARIEAPGQRTLRFDGVGADVDLHRFDAGVASGSEDSLAEAVELYRGPLLEGHFAEWLTPEREAHAAAALGALERLAELAAGRGERSAALGWLRRAERLDPLSDTTQRRIMQLLAEGGDAAGAVQVYVEHRGRLRRELNVDPDPETSRLFQEIRGSVRRGARPVPAPQTASAAASTGPAGLPGAAAAPHPLTPLVGRESELEAIARRLETARLVTLAGPGGVGKTRLGIETAHAQGRFFRDGAAFVELASLTNPALLPELVAGALGFPEPRDGGAGSAVEALAAGLSLRDMLLVLDNCEHLSREAAALAGELLRRCPEVRILATSRQPLGLTGEGVWRVPSLAAPPGDPPAGEDGASAEDVTAWLEHFPATRLFMQRAEAARAGFQPTPTEARCIARLCRALDGLPLAIELAAARVRVLGVTQIAARLESALGARFGLLTGEDTGAPTRHQTLRALIDWSYDLLAEEERALFRRVAVFPGSFALEAAEAVCAGVRMNQCAGEQGAHPHTGSPAHPLTLDLLTRLVDRSLIVVEPADREHRYRLQGTVREYALEKLAESGEEGSVRGAAVGYFLEVAEGAAAAIFGPAQEELLARLDLERENLRAALEWLTAGTHDDALQRLRLSAALWPYWWLRGQLREGLHHLKPAVQTAPDAPRSLRGQALLGSGTLALALHELESARSAAAEALAEFEATGDTRGAARALLVSAIAASVGHERKGARQLLDRSLALSRSHGHTAEIAAALTFLGYDMSINVEAEARRYAEEGLALARQTGDPHAIADALHTAAVTRSDDGALEQVRGMLEELLELHRRSGCRQEAALTLVSLGHVMERAAEPQEACRCFEDSATLWRELGNSARVGWSLLFAGNVLYRQGAYREASTRYEESRSFFQRGGERLGVACAANNLGSSLFHCGEPRVAAALHAEALESYRTSGDDLGTAWSLERLAVAAARLEEEDALSVRRMAAAAEIRARRQEPPSPADQADLDDAAAALRGRMGEADFERAWATRGLSVSGIQPERLAGGGPESRDSDV
jgi:predicted ATPase/DNA-binding SARP family transcriptional activator